MSTPGGADPAVRSGLAGSSEGSGTRDSRPGGTGTRDGGTAETERTYLVATAVIGAGLMLTTLPLRSVFTDWTWFAATLACAAPYWAVVAFFRGRSEPLWWHSLLGLLGSALVLMWIFVPQHLALGIAPTWTSATDVSNLVDSARHGLQVEHAPLASTNSLRFMTAGLLSLLVALTDILGVGLRRPLLAGAPMLEILAVASTTSSKPTRPIWFLAAAAGFLLIVLASTRLQDRHWGPAIDGSLGRIGGVRTIAAGGMVAALIVPLVLPGRSENLIAKATHHSSNGSGSGHQVVLSNFVSLSGQLKQGNPVDLLQVTTRPGERPYYIRQSVLDRFDDSGWSESPTPASDLGALSASNYSVAPEDALRSGGASQPDGSLDSSDASTATDQIDAKFTVLALGGTNLPLLANPHDIRGSVTGSWNTRDATVDDTKLRRDLTYFEEAAQPAPTKEQLLAAPPLAANQLRQYIDLPAQPASVVALAAKITAGKATAYDKAVAIRDYFTDGQNGFIYSLSAPTNDGRKAIETFLDKKTGYCQQYAAAAAVLLREAGLPTRVVLGYTHSAADSTGSFVVTTHDAHAWVESYFSGVGWIAFDPTPLSGVDAARTQALPYAPRPATTTAPSSGARAKTSAAPIGASKPLEPKTSQASSAAAAAGTTAGESWHWLSSALELLGVLVVLALLLAGPRVVRQRQRRRRFAQGRQSGTVEPLWQEVASSALDQDALWPETMTANQVPAWLGRHGLDERGTIAVASLARQLEQDRFSARPTADLPESTVLGVDDALRRWGHRAERRERLLYRWIPRSLLRVGRSVRR